MMWTDLATEIWVYSYDFQYMFRMTIARAPVVGDTLIFEDSIWKVSGIYFPDAAGCRAKVFVTADKLKGVKVGDIFKDQKG